MQGEDKTHCNVETHYQFSAKMFLAKATNGEVN